MKHRGDNLEPHNGVGRPHGPRVEPFDRWFRYPAGFNSVTLSECFSVAKVQSGSLIVDPFAGVGTTGVEASRRGCGFVGIEAHPQIAELANLKLKRLLEPQCILDIATQLANDGTIVDPRSEHPMIQRSFQTDTLARLLGLRNSIKGMKSTPCRPYLKWCLLAALRDCASVNVGWPYQRPGLVRNPKFIDPYRAFLRRARWMVEDLNCRSRISRQDALATAVHAGDSREQTDWGDALSGRMANAIITSPPYLNNFDYADATRLEMYFWGVARSWREMTESVRSDMMIATTQQTKKALTVSATEKLEHLCPMSASKVRKTAVALAKERSERPRGKEYDRLLPSYFADLAQILVQVRTHAAPQAPIALVLGDSAPYGIYVDTPSLLSSIGEELGFESVCCKTLRHRGLRWHSNGVRHSVALTEKLMLLRAP